MCRNVVYLVGMLVLGVPLFADVFCVVELIASLYASLLHGTV
jgi:hypothetical protein